MAIEYTPCSFNPEHLAGQQGAPPLKGQPPEKVPPPGKVWQHVAVIIDNFSNIK